MVGQLAVAILDVGAAIELGHNCLTQDRHSLFSSLPSDSVDRSAFRLGSLSVADNSIAVQPVDQNCEQNNHQQRTWLFQKLKEIGLNVIPSEGNFLFIHFEDSILRDEIHHKLLSNGLSTKRMDQFGDANSLRITIGNKHSNEKLIFTLR